MKTIQKLIFCAFCVLSLSATAQWQWLDKDGRKVFSDTPPPSDIPESKILRKPNQRGKPGDVQATMPAPEAAPVAKAAGGDKDLMDKKKLAEKQAAEADAAKRKAEEERVARVQADNCVRARQAKAGFDSGARLSRTNDKGEREYYDDATRAEETQRLQGMIDQNCK
jgi:Domain of unknown function (DUF4124)